MTEGFLKICHSIRLGIVICILISALRGLTGGAFAQGSATVEEYLAHAADATLVPADELEIDGVKSRCGRRPTIMDPGAASVSAAPEGFIVLNPRHLEKLPTPVKLWTFAQACGHYFRGPDLGPADCFAVQRGRRQNWLTPEGFAQVCAHAGDSRCNHMRLCWDDPDMR